MLIISATPTISASLITRLKVKVLIGGTAIGFCQTYGPSNGTHAQNEMTHTSGKQLLNSRNVIGD